MAAMIIYADNIKAKGGSQPLLWVGDETYSMSEPMPGKPPRYAWQYAMLAARRGEIERDDLAAFLRPLAKMDAQQIADLIGVERSRVYQIIQERGIKGSGSWPPEAVAAICAKPAVTKIERGSQ